MAISRINVGTLANDGTGDDLRQAFVKVNNNIDDLDARVQAQATAANLGSGTGVFASKESGVIGLKSLVAGVNVEITSDSNTVTISNAGTIAIQGTSGAGSLTGANRTLIVQGGQNINTTAMGNTITVAVTGDDLVQRDTAPRLGGVLNGDTNNMTNVGIIQANEFQGPLTGTVDGISVSNIYNVIKNVRGVDMGTFTTSFVSGLDYLISQSVINFGTVSSPNALNSDYGSIV